METQYLNQLIEIERSQSMRDAAEKLFVSQAALSHNLKKLETELDCQLFERSRNQLALNPYGRIMLEHAKRIIEELDQAKDEIAQEKLRQAEKIRVGVYGYAFQSFVMPSLANAIQENTFVCHNYESGQLREKLADGTLDVIFTDRPECDDELWTFRLFQEQVMVSLPASSEFASRQSIFLSDLRQLNILLVLDASGYTPWFERILKLADVASTQVDRISFREYLYNKDGAEQCHMTSSFILRFHPTVARRVVLPLADEVCRRDICLCCKKQDVKRLSPLLDYLDKHQQQLFSGNAFLPFFLFPDQTKNLTFCND